MGGYIPFSVTLGGVGTTFSIFRSGTDYFQNLQKKCPKMLEIGQNHPFFRGVNYQLSKLFVSFPLEMHIVHKKIGEENFLSVPAGLAVTGFFFEVNKKLKR